MLSRVIAKNVGDVFLRHSVVVAVAAAAVRLLVSALNVQTQGAQLTKHKRFRRSFELSESDVRLSSSSSSSTARLSVSQSNQSIS